MTLRELYEKAVTIGIANDPRGAKEAGATLTAAKEEWKGLKKSERAYFDVERLQNPYDDSRILNGPPETKIRSILAGIDIGEGELVLADRLREKGRKIDAVVAHHPSAHALARLPDLMGMQAGLYAVAGVPIGQAEGVLEPRIREVASRVQPANHQRAADAARLLEIPLVCFHTVADNCVSNHLDGLFVRKNPKTLGDVMDLLHAIPEFDIARREQTGPVIVAGSKKSRAGKIFIEMTGGTEGAREMYAKLARAGVSTIVGMHLSKEHAEAAKAENFNIVLAGHISSDNLGVNLLFDACFGDKVEVIGTSGFRRVKRAGKKGS
jgi:putative NIF3 family GTP cyclohydrolase 1 type 2